MTRVILDEGVPRPLAKALRERGVDASPFPNKLKQLSNGHLLTEIERRNYQILITNDKKMPFQQNLTGRNLAVLVLPNNKFKAVNFHDFANCRGTGDNSFW